MQAFSFNSVYYFAGLEILTGYALLAENLR